MSSEVKDATQAMEIARRAAVAAGLTYNIVTEAKRQDPFWFVSIYALFGTFIVKIKASTGEVVELSPAK